MATTFFFQAQFPHDVTQTCGGSVRGVSCRKQFSVHTAYGVGVYRFLRDYEVTEESAISTPSAIASDFSALHSVSLDETHYQRPGCVNTVLWQWRLCGGEMVSVGIECCSDYSICLSAR